MHFTKRPRDRWIIAAESRPSSYCHPERSAARAVVEEERFGACGRRAVEGPITSSAGGLAGRKKREALRLRAGPAHPASSSAISPTPPPQATRRSAQDDRLFFGCGAARQLTPLCTAKRLSRPALSARCPAASTPRSRRRLASRLAWAGR